MAWFEVRLIAGGRVRSIEVEAPDVRGARDQLSARGRILEVRRRRKVGTWSRSLDRNERHILFIRLAAMLESKVGLAEALRRIAASFRGRIRRTAERMADAVELGDDLAGAMQRQPRDFSPTLVALVRAGGFGEGTATALRTAAEFEQQLAGARQSFRSGLLLAVLYVVMSGVVMVGTSFFLTPLLLETEVFKRAGEEVDVGWVYLLSDLTTGVVALVLLALGLMAGVATVGRRLAPRQADRAMQRVPLYRDIALGVQNHVTFRELSLLVGGGVPIDRALSLTAEGAPPGALRADLEAATRAVTLGLPWTDAMRGVHGTDRASLAAAENRSELARSLAALAEQYRDLYLHAVAVTEPVLRGISVAVVGVAGIVMFGLTIIPILQLAEHISRQPY